MIIWGGVYSLDQKGDIYFSETRSKLGRFFFFNWDFRSYKLYHFSEEENLCM